MIGFASSLEGLGVKASRWNARRFEVWRELRQARGVVESKKTKSDSVATTEGGKEGSRVALVRETVSVFLRLGCTSFGGPVAHLGYFQNEFVQRRRWVNEATFADVVALCQFLPGPASSQVCLVLGYLRSGLMGGVLGWMAFTFPSAVLMIGFAYGVHVLQVETAGWLMGL